MEQAIARIHKTAGDRADDVYIAVGETGWPGGMSLFLPEIK